MHGPAQISRPSVDDDLAAEDGADVRHAFIDGELYAMAGASRFHGLIVGNLYAHLRPLVRGTRYQRFANDMNVRLKVRCGSRWPSRTSSTTRTCG
ncbi:Uma2 family endonuclease [Thiorhodococcus minor]|uniref:Uma2 family endonuclease n=1 Tax=Thiorhodococcus minor TaxID=57489 RepID=UPI00315893C9